MILKPVTSLKQALQVRVLRNTCREHLTNHKDHIGIVQQITWYFRYYRSARANGKYRLYLLCDEHGSPVAYGALLLKDDKLLVTECVTAKSRGKGYGKEILTHLVHIANQEGRDMVAEIWTSNERSIALHEKVGFELVATNLKQEQELRTYLLSV